MHECDINNYIENEGKSSFEVRENEVIKQSARLRG